VGEALIAGRRRLDGEQALAFLAELPALVERWQVRLGLTGARIMPGGVLSAAFACRRLGDGARVVLKLSAAHATSARAEAAALRVWDGTGACPLRYASGDGRVMLLDAIEPGLALAAGDEHADAAGVARLLGTLHRTRADQLPDAIPDAASELRWRFERAHRILDGPSYAADLAGHGELDAAHAAALTLHRSLAAGVLCHGDFMGKNILLDAAGAWWAIDPRPCAGDPCMDAAFWALSHRPGVAVPRRCELVAVAAGLERDRVLAWARAFAVSETVLANGRAKALAHHRAGLDLAGG
jgi:streptomycin 6-kinase